MENILQYKFQNPDLLQEALCHPSFAAENNCASYERLEFLGDSVLGLIIAQMLFKQFPDEPEGGLAKRRSAIVCGQSLADTAIALKIPPYMVLNQSEQRNDGRSNPANLENTLEAIIGAIYIDGGLEAVSEFVNRIFAKKVQSMTKTPQDDKSLLQEWSQGHGFALPIYKVISIEGPSHMPEFVVEVAVEENGSARGQGSSKKQAQRNAAKELYQQISQGL